MAQASETCSVLFPERLFSRRPGAGQGARSIVLLGFLGVLLVLLLTGVIYQVAGAARDARAFPPPGRMVDIGGVRLHLSSAGPSGPVIILDSGIGASSLSWGLVMPELARFARVHAYDRAGLGWSERARRPRLASLLAEELHMLLDRAGISGPYILVAHSFGGYVERLFANNYPGEVAAMVLVDSPDTSEWIHPTPERIKRLRGGAFFCLLGAWLARAGVVRFCLNRLGEGATSIPQAVTKSFGRTAFDLTKRMVGQVMKLPAESWRVAQAHWSCPESFLSLANHLHHLPESAAEVAACGSLGDLPLVVLTASEPSPERREHQDAVARLSSRGRHIVADRGGHWLHLDEPELVIEAIRSVSPTATR